jgi:hypothetical protein
MVCARPDKPSDLVIDETSNEPAATVPATPIPFRTWANPRTLTIFLWCASGERIFIDD